MKKILDIVSIGLVGCGAILLAFGNNFGFGCILLGCVIELMIGDIKKYI